ncbi:MAG TPA: hypothetical protein PKN56_08785 [Leptospiraceae bacterium]|nr:hypothetical protein [Leptospiraceae bacterium]HMY65601.1 hypothetical protein [Leptospiraceae bacterium]HNF27538.1 hypothetical protein [Leptospiraceae bacterium]HNH07801.1 hypothetical protein [Leptospiraceae bacterium]HNI95649.1 hypothetical protein [Leptospiraceae bacterium]
MKNAIRNFALVLLLFFCFPVYAEERKAGESYIHIEWEPVEGGTEYVLQIAADRDFTKILHSQKTKDTLIKLPPNPRYKFARLAGVDSQGITGQFSDIFEIKTRIVKPKPEIVKIEPIPEPPVQKPQRKFLTRQDTVQLVAESRDTVSIFYQSDSPKWKLYTKPISIEKDGRTVIYHFGMDASGKKEPIKSLSVDVDNTPPDVGIEFTNVLQYEMVMYSGPSSRIRISASDSLSGIRETRLLFQSGNDFVEKINAIEEKIPEIFAGKQFFVTALAYDQAGNRTEKTYRFRHDLTPPKIEIFPKPNMKKSWSVGDKFFPKVEDELTGIKYAEYSVNNGGFKILEKEIELNTPGLNIIEIRAWDHAENFSSEKFYFDLTAAETKTNSILNLNDSQ